MTRNRKFATGDLITNGSSAGKVLKFEYDARWKSWGYRIENVALEAFGGSPGYSSFVPDYLAASWWLMPLDWAPIVGGGLEARYVRTTNGRYQRELRRIGDAS